MLDAFAVIARACVYLGLLTAAGSILSALTFGAPLTGNAILRVRLGAGVAMMAVIVGVLVLLARLGGALDPAIASAVLSGPTGYAAGLFIGSAVLMTIATILPQGLRAVVATLGGLTGLMGFAVNGHAAASGIAPAGLVLVHACLVAWWIGALFLLETACREREDGSLSDLLQRFTRQATLMVLSLYAVGGVLLVVLIEGEAQRLVSSYGLGLLLKLSAVGSVFALVLWNRLRLTPRIAAGDPQAAGALLRNVRIELALIAVVLTATAAWTTLTSPH